MKIKPSISLIVTTYNWPEALRLSLMSIAQQTLLPKEVIIADDGSTADTQALVEEFQRSFPCPLIHVWQEDTGFRLAQIRNKSIAKACGDYIIQIDGDVILEKHFIADHLSIAREGYCVSGSRITLRKDFSKKVLSKRLISINLFEKGASHKLNALRNKYLRIYFSNHYEKKYKYYARGCNMAFWKRNLIDVNGYNEDFTGWGAEDNEIIVRLSNLGIKRQFLKFGGVQYHIYHDVRERREFNYDTILKNSIESKAIRCDNGINKYV